MSTFDELCTLQNASEVTDSLEQNDLWYVGVVLGGLGAITANLGMNLQKYSLREEIKRVDAANNGGQSSKAEAKVEQEVDRQLEAEKLGPLDMSPYPLLTDIEENEQVNEKHYLRQPLWILGLLFVILGSSGELTALLFAPQTLVTPLSGTALVANLFFGHFWLKEKVSLRDLAATSLILIGIVNVALAAEKNQLDLNFNCINFLFSRAQFIIYAVCIVLFMFMMRYLTIYLARIRRDDPFRYSNLALRHIHAIIPSSLAGANGAMGALLMKSLIVLLQLAVNGEHKVFKNWIVYIFFSLVLFTIASQLHWLAHSLRLFDAIVVIPMLKGTYMVGGVLNGAVVFNEFATLSAKRLVWFFAGLFTTLFGMAWLAFRKQYDFQAPTSPGAGISSTKTAISENKVLQSL